MFGSGGSSSHCVILQRVPTGQRNPPEQTLSVTKMQWPSGHFLFAGLIQNARDFERQSLLDSRPKPLKNTDC
jgi:hypothetical protein